MLIFHTRRWPGHHWVMVYLHARVEPGHEWLYAGMVRRDTLSLLGVGFVVMRMPNAPQDA